MYFREVGFLFGQAHSMLASAMLRIGTETSEYARGVLHPHVQYYVLRSVEGIFMLMALLRIIVRQRLKFHRQDGALVIIACYVRPTKDYFIGTRVLW